MSPPPGTSEEGERNGRGSGSGEEQSPSVARCQHRGGARWHPLRHAVMVAIEAAAERDCRLFPSTRVRLRRGEGDGVEMGEDEGEEEREEHRGKKARVEEMKVSVVR